MSVSKDGISRVSLGNHFQCLTTLPAKNVFLTLKWNFLYFSLHPLSLTLSLDTLGKTQAPSSLRSPIRYLSTLLRSCLFFSKLNSPRCLSLSSYIRCSNSLISLWPFDGLTPVCPCVLYWQTHYWTQHSRCRLISFIEKCLYPPLKPPTFIFSCSDSY